MAVHLETTGTVQGFERTLKAAVENDKAGTVIVLACDANDFRPERLDPILNALPVPVIGGTFPAIIHGDTKLEKGTIVVSLQTRAQCIQLGHVSDPTVDFINAIGSQIPAIPAKGTLLIFLDAFTKRINELIGSLFNVFGLEFNYIGGAAGALSMKPKPCIITNQGLKMDAAVVARLDCPSSVGACHGWTSIAGPFRITGSQNNVTKTIDGRPAFDLYRDVLTRYSKIQISRENFFSIAKGFPFGIARIEAEPVVRDPVAATPEGYLVSVGEIPAGSFVDILSGDIQSLLEAARKAKRVCDANRPAGLRRPVNLFLDSFSRALFLGKHYAEEIKAVRTPGQALVGACTMGEIAHNGSESIEFYNKTAVVAVMEGA